MVKQIEEGFVCPLLPSECGVGGALKSMGYEALTCLLVDCPAGLPAEKATPPGGKSDQKEESR